MRLALRVLLALFVLTVAVGAGGLYFALASARDNHEVLRAQLKARIDEHLPALLADQERLATHPLVVETRGEKDAGPYLNPRVPWSGGEESGTKAPLSLPEDVVAALKPDPQALGEARWLERKDLLADARLDTAWMKELSRFDHWDLEQQSPLAAHPGSWVSAPLPDFLTLLSWAKLRLLRGVQDADLLAAHDDVHALARLLFTSENLVGSMVGVAVLGAVDAAHAHALTLGQDPGFAPMPLEEREQLRRMLWGMVGVPGLSAPDGLAERVFLTDAPRAGRCTALQEGLWMALTLRGFLGDARRERYAELTRVLEGSPQCRLRRLRRAWASDAPPDLMDLCVEIDCSDGWPKKVQGLPFVRELVGENLAAISAPDFFRHYDKAAP